MSFLKQFATGTGGAVTTGLTTGLTNLMRQEQQRRQTYQKLYWDQAEFLIREYSDILRSPYIDAQSRQNITAYIDELSQIKMPQYQNFWQRLGIGTNYTMTLPEQPKVQFIDKGEKGMDLETYYSRLGTLNSQVGQFIDRANKAPTYDLYVSNMNRANDILAETSTLTAHIVEGPVKPPESYRVMTKSEWENLQQKPEDEGDVSERERWMYGRGMSGTDEIRHKQVSRQLKDVTGEIKEKEKARLNLTKEAGLAKEKLKSLPDNKETYTETQRQIYAESMAVIQKDMVLWQELSALYDRQSQLRKDLEAIEQPYQKSQMPMPEFTVPKKETPKFPELSPTTGSYINSALEGLSE